MSDPNGRDTALDRAVAHLFDETVRLMQRHGQAFVPLDTVRARLGWDDQTLGEVVDAVAEGHPVVFGGLVAEWIHDGERPAYGRSRARLIGIRPA